MTLTDVLPYLDDEEAAERIRLAELLEHADNPAYWVKDVLGEHLWSKQVEIAESVRDNRYTAVHSAHDTGKSFVASRVVAWWLSTHEPGEAFVVSTAPSYSQVRAILWREIRAAHKKGRLRGRTNQTEWWMDSAIVGYGRRPEDCDVATAFSGIHARYVLVVADEASGIPKGLWDAVDTLVTNEDSRVLAIGNPDDSTSHFAKICKPGSGWNTIHVDGLQTPNFTDEPVPDSLRPLLLSPTWVEERKARWGEDSPIYTAKVRGIFPEFSDDGVVPLSWARQCQRKALEPGEPVQLGVDVGLGGDLSVIYERRGRVAGQVWTNNSRDPMVVAGEVVQAIRTTGAKRVVIDQIGVGWSVLCRLQELGREGAHAAEILGVNVGDHAADRTRFARLRDDIWWSIGRENSEAHTWDLSAVSDDTIGELIAPRFSIDSAGRVSVEKKDVTRARIGKSPDAADALLLAFYEPSVKRPTFLGAA